MLVDGRAGWFIGGGDEIANERVMADEVHPHAAPGDLVGDAASTSRQRCRPDSTWAAESRRVSAPLEGRRQSHDSGRGWVESFRLGGDLEVGRVGFGALRITGKGCVGPPDDPAAMKRLLRRVVAL